jgi:predicted metal-dependent hydrolase
MNFEIPSAADLDPKWVSGNSFSSYMATAVSLYVAYLEPFLVKSLRRVLDQVSDPVLKENVDRFCRQEAQHYRQHERFNEAILGMDYPGLKERFDILKADFENFLDHKSDKWRVGFVEGFEAYTTQTALAAFKSGGFDDPRTDPRFGALFKWHLAEELEHRHVAYDIYEHLYGDYFFRAKMCLVAQMHIWRFALDCMKIMSPVDVKRHDSSYHIGLPMRVFASVMVAPLFVKTYLPGYSPYKLDVPDNITMLSQTLTEQAEKVL